MKSCPASFALRCRGEANIITAKPSAIRVCRQLHVAESAVVSIIKCHIQPAPLQQSLGYNPTGHNTPWSLLRAGRDCDPKRDDPPSRYMRAVARLSVSVSTLVSSDHWYLQRQAWWPCLWHGNHLSAHHPIEISRRRIADFAPGMLAVGRGGLSVAMSHQDSAYTERPQACLDWSSRTGLPNNVIVI